MAWIGEAPPDEQQTAPPGVAKPRPSKWIGEAPPDEAPFEQAKQALGNEMGSAWDNFSVINTALNVPSSGVNFLKNMVTPILHPVQTVEGLGKMGLGFIEKLIPGDQGHEAYAEAIINHYKERYGGVPELLKTIETDPVGFATDLSALLGGGGAVANLVSKGGTTAKVLSSASKALNPITAPVEIPSIFRQAVSKTKLPESIYGRTMKMPPGSVRDEVQNSVLNTLVREEKISLGKTSLHRMKTAIGELDTKIDDALEFIATHTGADMDINTIVTALDTLKSKYKNRSNPQPYYDAIDAVKQEYIGHSFVRNGRIALDDAVQLKKGTYQEIQNYYMKGQKPETGRIGIQNDIDSVAKAEVARTIKQVVLEHPDIPDGIKAAMRREAGLMNARKWVERATNRGGNLDPVNITGMLFGVLVEKGLPGAAAWRVAMSQPVMSRLAILLAGGSSKMDMFEQVAMPVTTGLAKTGALPFFSKESE